MFTALQSRPRTRNADSCWDNCKKTSKKISVRLWYPSAFHITFTKLGKQRLKGHLLLHRVNQEAWRHLVTAVKYWCLSSACSVVKPKSTYHFLAKWPWWKQRVRQKDVTFFGYVCHLYCTVEWMSASLKYLSGEFSYFLGVTEVDDW